MTSAETNTDTNTLSFPLKLTTNSLDAGSIVINADLAAGTLALLSGTGTNIQVSVNSPEDYASAADELSKIKAVAKQIDEQRKELTKPIDKEKQRVMDYVRPFTDALTRAESAFKSALINYDNEQERKRRLAEASEAERLRKEQEKIEARAEKAEASGKTEKADALREIASTNVYSAPAAIATAEPLKVSGLSSRKVFSAEVTDLMTLVKAVAAGTVPIKALSADMTFLNKMAAALKDEYDYPGTKLVIGTSMASRAKR